MELLNTQEIKQLAIHAVKGTAPTEFSNAADYDVNQALADQLNGLAKDFNAFRRNRIDIYEIMQTVADEYLPKSVKQTMSSFAQIESVPNGQKKQFVVKKGKARAKKFVTQVGLSGIYETFRLDSETFELGGQAIGGASRVDFERLSRGEESIVEYMDIVLEGLEDAIYGAVQKALRAAFNNTARPSNNKATMSSFEANTALKVINTVKAYGTSAVIYAPPEFIAAMGADLIGAAGKTPNYATDDIDSIHFTGKINIFRGTPIIELPQSFTDESNTTTQIDPQMAYVFPTGGEKVVKIVLEGDTIVDDYKCKDRSLEVSIYKKIGVAILTQHNWGILKNTGITQTYTEDGIL